MRQTTLITLGAIVITLLTFGCGYFKAGDARPPSKALGTEIERIVTRIYQNGQFTGSVLVSVKGEIVFKKGFGYANAENACPIRS